MNYKNIIKVAALMMGVAFFILLIRYGLREELPPAKKYQSQVEVSKVSEKKPHPPVKKVSTLKKKIVPRKQKTSTSEEFKQQYKRYLAFADLLIQEDKKCAAKVEKLIPGEDFIDHSDEMYKNFDDINMKVTELQNAIWRLSHLRPLKRPGKLLACVNLKIQILMYLNFIAVWPI